MTGKSRRTRCLLVPIATLLLLLANAETSRATPMDAIAYDWHFDLNVEQIVPNEFIESTALGQAWLHYDVIADHLSILVTWTDLVGELDRIHIHGPALPGINERSHVVDVLTDPANLPPGTGRHTGQLQSVRHLFEAGDQHGGGHGGNYLPERALEILISEEAYMLIHTTTYFDGEIRGQLVLTQTTVPEPQTALLFALGLVGLARVRERRATLPIRRSQGRG